MNYGSKYYQQDFDEGQLEIRAKLLFRNIIADNVRKFHIFVSNHSTLPRILNINNNNNNIGDSTDSTKSTKKLASVVNLRKELRRQKL